MFGGRLCNEVSWCYSSTCYDMMWYLSRNSLHCHSAVRRTLLIQTPRLHSKCFARVTLSYGCYDLNHGVLTSLSANTRNIHYSPVEYVYLSNKG